MSLKSSLLGAVLGLVAATSSSSAATVCTGTAQPNLATVLFNPNSNTCSISAPGIFPLAKDDLFLSVNTQFSANPNIYTAAVNVADFVPQPPDFFTVDGNLPNNLFADRAVYLGFPGGTFDVIIQSFVAGTVYRMAVNITSQGTRGGTFLINSASVSAVPIPAALPLLASGLGALGVIGWRRKRKTT